MNWSAFSEPLLGSFRTAYFTVQKLKDTPSARKTDAFEEWSSELFDALVNYLLQIGTFPVLDNIKLNFPL